MKEELLKKSIKQLEKDLYNLRLEKSGEYQTLDIIKKEIITSDKKNNSILQETNKLEFKNNELSNINTGLDENIALLNKKEQDIKKNLKIEQENLNNSILKHDKLKQDISTREKELNVLDYVYLEQNKTNIELRQEIEKNLALKEKNKELEVNILEQNEYLKKTQKEDNLNKQKIKEDKRVVALNLNNINGERKKLNLPFIKLENE